MAELRRDGPLLTSFRSTLSGACPRLTYTKSHDSRNGRLLPVRGMHGSSSSQVTGVFQARPLLRPPPDSPFHLEGIAAARTYRSVEPHTKVLPDTRGGRWS